MQLPARFIVIDPYRLSPAALAGILEDIVTRDGTDYGEHEVPLARKRETLLRQLQRREAQLVFDTETETVSALHSEALSRELEA